MNEPRGQIIIRKTEIISFFKLLFNFVKGTNTKAKDSFIISLFFLWKINPNQSGLLAFLNQNKNRERAVGRCVYVPTAYLRVIREALFNM